MNGIELIAKERQEQINKHGYTVDIDVEHNDGGQLVIGAMMLISDEFENVIPFGWNKDLCKKMKNKSHKEKLIIAGAFIAAEIDRLNHSE